MLVSIIKSDKRFGRYKPVIVVVCVELLHEPIDSIRPFLQPLLPADIEAIRKEIDDNHHEQALRKMGGDVRGTPS